MLAPLERDWPARRVLRNVLEKVIDVGKKFRLPFSNRLARLVLEYVEHALNLLVFVGLPIDRDLHRLQVKRSLPVESVKTIVVQNSQSVAEKRGRSRCQSSMKFTCHSNSILAFQAHRAQQQGTTGIPGLLGNP